jgi:uncharacterized protein with LGFP repeats
MTDVIGAIAQKWQVLGGAGGFGQPTDIDRPTFDGVGRTQPFAGANLCLAP